MGLAVGLRGGGRSVGGFVSAPVVLALRFLASPSPRGIFYSIGSTVTLGLNNLFFSVGSRGLSAGASLDGSPVGPGLGLLDGPPVGSDLGLLVGPGIVRLCSRRSSGGSLICRGDRRRVLLIIILLLLTRKIVFACEGELLPGPGRAVLVDGLDDNRGTGGPAVLARRKGLGGSVASAAHSLVVDVGRGTAAPAGNGLVVIDVGRVDYGRGHGGTVGPAGRDLVVVNTGRVGDGRGTAAPAVRGLVGVDVRLCYGHGSGRTTTPDARALVDVDVVDGFGLANALDGPGRLRAVDGCLSAPCLLARGAVRGLLPRSTARDLRLAHPDDPS